MKYEKELIEIESRDFWFKIVEFLQQNWALIETNGVESGCRDYFVNDTSGVFDELSFDNIGEAEAGLLRNGFTKYADDTESQKFIATPLPPFKRVSHPNGPIYSSGRFWRQFHQK